MKTILRFLQLLLLTAPVYVIGQTKQERVPCITDELIEMTYKADPAYRQRLDEINKKIERRIQEKKAQKSITAATTPLIIPVAVYVVHANSTDDTSDSQVTDQLNALNNYFSGTGIQFCRATRMGAGSTQLPMNSGNVQTTPGIIHITNSLLANHEINTEVTQLAALPAAQVTPQRCLRIWVVNQITKSGQTGIAGYASFPGEGVFIDGIVIKANCFGNITACPSCNLETNYDLGKTLVHEMGHYLGLYHTFYGECEELDPEKSSCTEFGDHVCDTPPTAGPNFTCTPMNSCDEIPVQDDFIHNYMDYGNDYCANSFTAGQIERMHYMIDDYLSALIQTENLNYVAACGLQNYLTASFNTNFTPCVNDTINFTPSISSGATYSWNFGDPSSASNTSTSQTPSHQYTSAAGSPYTVTLTVTVSGQTVTSTKQVYVTVCSPIVSTQGNWYFSTENGLRFNTGVPVYDDNANIHNNDFIEAAAVANDGQGNLLFYTNGNNVWNNNHTQINTTTMAGNKSSHNGSLIVPTPGNANQYYIFNKASEGAAGGFTYSRVTISGTTASMTDANTNIAITTPNANGYTTGTNGAITGGEGITAVASCNGYWIITTNRKPAGFFICVYELTSTTLNFISETALPTDMNSSSLVYINSVKASPDGNKIVFGAVTSGNTSGTYLFDFNKYTGQLSNMVNLNQTAAYGMTFSPNSRVLYVSGTSEAFQYNLDSTDILGTRKQMFGISSRGDFAIGPDNKIYSLSNPDLLKISIIHSPNNVISIGGNECQFTTDGVTILTNKSYGLPNFINALPATTYTNTISRYAVSCTNYKFAANVCGSNSSFSWNFGDPGSGSANTATGGNATHTFSAEGTYTVTLTTGSTVLTTTVTVGNPLPEISGDITACVSGNKSTSHTVTAPDNAVIVWSVVQGTGTIMGLGNQAGTVVQWSSLPGTIQATVTDINGCTYTIQQQITSYCPGDGCPANIMFTLAEPVSTSTYSASADIIAQDNYVVEASSNITLNAGTSITFKLNSHIKPDSVFLAKIYNCAGRPVAENTKETEIPFSADLTVYPNPTNGLLNIKGTGITEIAIFDVSGKQVYYKKEESTDFVTIDISGLQQGIYLLRTGSEKTGAKTVKVIKQ